MAILQMEILEALMRHGSIGIIRDRFNQKTRGRALIDSYQGLRPYATMCGPARLEAGFGEESDPPLQG
jgi:hypothetical protein